MEVLIPILTLGGLAIAQNNAKRQRKMEAAEEEAFVGTESGSLGYEPQPYETEETTPHYMLPMPTLHENYPQMRRGGGSTTGYGAAYLDHAMGQGSLDRKKKEHASMFAPMPKETETVCDATDRAERERASQSVLASNQQSGVRPFEPIHTRGNLPDHLMQRIPEPTVDDLRSAARPKADSASLFGLQGPAGGIQVPAFTPEHVMTKTTPDTFYENTPDMWFTTTGAVIAPASYNSEIQIDRHTAREDIAGVQYAGHATGTLKYATPGHYEESSRVEYQGDELPMGIAGRGDTVGGYLAPTEKPRSVAPRLRAPPIMALVGAFGSLVAPVLDFVRDRRAPEETMRPYGSMGLSGRLMSAVPEAPAQGPAPTKRDLLPQGDGHLFVERTNQNGGGGAGYLMEAANMRVPETERSRTTQDTYFGIGSSGAKPLAMTPYLSSPVQLELRNNVRAVTALAARTPGGKGVCHARAEVTGAAYRPDVQEDKRCPAPGGRCALPTLEAAGRTRLRPDASLSARLPDPSLIITDEVRRNPLLLPKDGIWK